MGLMSTRDFQNYTEIFNTLTGLISPRPADLPFQFPFLLWSTRSRNEAVNMKTTLRLDYLRRLNEYHEAWISKYWQDPHHRY